MLSNSYRQRMEFICSRIANGADVSLEDRIWASKLAQHNGHAATMLRKAQRLQQNPDMPRDGLDSFLNDLDLGDPDSRGIRHFSSPDDVTDFFRRDGSSDWRQRD